MFHGHPDFTHDSPKFRKGVTDASHASVTPVSHHDLWNGSPTFYRRPRLTSRYGLKKKERLDVSLTQPLHNPTSGLCSAINIKQSEKLCIAPSQHVILQYQDGSPIGVVPSCHRCCTILPRDCAILSRHIRSGNLHRKCCTNLPCYCAIP